MPIHLWADTKMVSGWGSVYLFGHLAAIFSIRVKIAAALLRAIVTAFIKITPTIAGGQMTPRFRRWGASTGLPCKASALAYVYLNKKSTINSVLASEKVPTIGDVAPAADAGSAGALKKIRRCPT